MPELEIVYSGNDLFVFNLGSVSCYSIIFDKEYAQICQLHRNDMATVHVEKSLPIDNEHIITLKNEIGYEYKFTYEAERIPESTTIQNTNFMRGSILFILKNVNDPYSEESTNKYNKGGQ